MVKRKLSDQDRLSLPLLYTRGLSTWEIAKRFDTYHSSILYHLKKLGIKRRDKSSAAKEGVKAGRIKIRKHSLPDNLVLNEDLSYILGVLCGDGYMDYNTKRMAYHIGLSAIDYEFVERFKRALLNFFKIEPTDGFKKGRRINWNDQYITRLCSKEACEYIITIGEFRKYNWHVPNIIRQAHDSIKYAFIRGFFDSEGGVDRGSGRVEATSMNLIGLKQIGDLLSELNIEFTILKKRDLRPNTHQKYVLRINNRNSIKSFMRLIGFTIQRKQRILEVTMFPRDRERLVP